MAHETIITLPTYQESIANFVQPPSYHTALVTNPEPYDAINRALANEFLRFHQFAPLRYKSLTAVNEEDELILDYQIVSNDQIMDLKLSLEILIQDKLIQIERNSKFIKNNIKTLQRNYFIDKLRDTTLTNFNAIYEKLQLELFNLDELFANYMKFNTQYNCLLHNCPQWCGNQEKPRSDNQTIDQLNNLRHNLSLIRTKIETLSSTNDISYILKERARIYNDAKQVIQNQRRSSENLRRST